MMALTPDDRRRLAGVLARLSSDHAGERDAAALAATRIVRDRAVTWLDVLRTDTPADMPGAGGFRPNTTSGADLAFCFRHLGRLNAWERGFVQSVAKVLRHSEGQSRKLAEIADALRKNGAE